MEIDIDKCFTDIVKLHPEKICTNIKENILVALKNKMEGVCTYRGYIKKESIKIIDVGPGKVDISLFHGFMNYPVKYSCKVCNPVRDDIVSATILNINNFGILCTASMIENGKDTPILEIIVPKHSPAVQSEVDLNDSEAISRGAKVMVQIVEKMYQLKNKKISIIGRIVRHGSSQKNKYVDNVAQAGGFSFENEDEILSEVTSQSDDDIDDEQDDVDDEYDNNDNNLDEDDDLTNIGDDDFIDNEEDAEDIFSDFSD